jgi:hypothetical protein
MPTRNPDEIHDRIHDRMRWLPADFMIMDEFARISGIPHAHQTLTQTSTQTSANPVQAGVLSAETLRRAQDNLRRMSIEREHERAYVSSRNSQDVRNEPGRLIFFDRNGEQVCILDWREGRLRFYGNADSAAMHFLNYLKHDVSMDREMNRGVRGSEPRSVYRGNFF